MNKSIETTRYAGVFLRVLAQMGGSGTRPEILDRAEEVLRKNWRPSDRERIGTQVRKRLRETGLVERRATPGTGKWEIRKDLKEILIASFSE